MARPKKLRATQSMLRLDISILKAEDLLTSGLYYERAWSITGRNYSKIGIFTQSDGLLLNYSYNGRSLSYKVYFAYTKCNYGGQRKWFICPKCGKYARIIYAGEHFLCRSCQGLNYASQKNRSGLRYSKIKVLSKIRSILGNSEEITRYSTRLLCIEKPKGMHWLTYEKLLDEAEQVELDIWNEDIALEKQRNNCFSRIAKTLIGEVEFTRYCKVNSTLQSLVK